MLRKITQGILDCLMDPTPDQIALWGEQEDARGVGTISETDNVNVLQAMNELQSLFENIAGVSIEEEKERNCRRVGR